MAREPADLAPPPEVIPEEEPKVEKWKPNPRPAPKAWIRPTKVRIDVAGF